MSTIEEYTNELENKWCPGCGNFGILDSMKNALVNLDLSPHQIVLVSGIGQAAKTPHFLNCNYFHALHGRALPLATGVKLANHELKVIVNSGDGDCYGEGGSHFMNAVRRNIDLTLLVHENKVYGLTKGQAAPTADLGFETRAQTDGVIAEPFNALTIALSLGAGFVARSFSNNRRHLTQMIEKAVQYRGLSLVSIMQPCVVFNKVNTNAWYKSRAYDLAEKDHDDQDLSKALELSKEWGENIPIGILYQKEKKTFTDRIAALNEGPIVKRAYARQALQGELDRL